MTFTNSQFKRKIFKYRLKPRFRKKFLVGGIIFSLLLLISLLAGPISSAYESLTNPVATGKIKVDWYKDLNSVHLQHAKRNGIKPFKSTQEFHSGIDKLLENKKLVKIEDNKFFVVKHLTHSHPYLTPAANNFINELGKRYRQKLKDNKMKGYQFQISSLLRTNESQKSLSRTNVNASSNTAHLYGATLDIAYKSVISRPLPWVKVEVADAKAIKLLSETIGEMRKEGRCFVVTERIEKCFHVTVVR